MASKINWLDGGEVWNPVAGCSKASPGCNHCYALRLVAGRLNSSKTADFASGPNNPDGVVLIKWWPPGPRALTRRRHPQWTGQVRLLPHRLEQPLRWRKPRRIFVVDKGDLFHPLVPFEYIAAVFGVMAACPQHTFILLTKRAERMVEFYRWIERKPTGLILRDPWPNFSCILAAHDAAPDAMVPGGVPRIAVDGEQPWPLPNVWPGVSVENADYTHRIAALCDVPIHETAYRVISNEPALGPLSLTEMGWPENVDTFRGGIVNHSDMPGEPRRWWVIQGCESGRDRRPFELDWARSLRDQCLKAQADGHHVHYFLKQIPVNGEVQSDPLPELDGRQHGDTP